MSTTLEAARRQLFALQENASKVFWIRWWQAERRAATDGSDVVHRHVCEEQSVRMSLYIYRGGCIHTCMHDSWAFVNLYISYLYINSWVYKKKMLGHCINAVYADWFVIKLGTNCCNSQCSVYHILKPVIAQANESERQWQVKATSKLTLYAFNTTINSILT